MPSQTPAPPPFTVYRLIGAEVIEVPPDQIEASTKVQLDLLKSDSLRQMTGGQPLVDIEAFESPETGLLCLQVGTQDQKTHAWRVGQSTPEGLNGMQGIDQKITVAARAMLNPLKPPEEHIQAPDLTAPTPPSQPTDPAAREGQPPEERTAASSQQPPVPEQQPGDPTAPPAQPQQQQPPAAPAPQQPHQPAAPVAAPLRPEPPAQAPRAPLAPPVAEPPHPLAPVDPEEERLLQLNADAANVLSTRLETDLDFGHLFGHHDAARLAVGVPRPIPPRHKQLIEGQREAFISLLETFKTDALETFADRQGVLENLNRVHLQNHKNPPIENPQHLIFRERDELQAHHRETNAILQELFRQQHEELGRFFNDNGAALRVQRVPAALRDLIINQQTQLQRQFAHRRNGVINATIRDLQQDRTDIQKEQHRTLCQKIVNDSVADIATITAEALTAVATATAERDAAVAYQNSLPALMRASVQAAVDQATAALNAATTAQTAIALQSAAATAAQGAIAVAGADYIGQATAAAQARVAAREQGAILAAQADLAKLATESRTVLQTAQASLEQAKRYRQLVQDQNVQALIDAQIVAARNALQVAGATHRAILASVAASNAAPLNLPNVTHRRDQAKIQKIKQELSQIAFHMNYLKQLVQIEGYSLRSAPESEEKRAQMEQLGNLHEATTRFIQHLDEHFTAINSSIDRALLPAAARTEVQTAQEVFERATAEPVNQLVGIAKMNQEQIAQTLRAAAAPQPQRRGRSWLRKGALTVGTVALLGAAAYLGSSIGYSDVAPMTLLWSGNTT